MLDLGFLPSATGTGTSEFFVAQGNTSSTTLGFITWQKPRGKSMINILLVGNGGNGGAGVIGANSTAAGGGGGGSGSQVVVCMPLHLLPDTLYIWLFASGTVGSRVSIYPDTTTQHCVAFANPGGAGGNASGATAGAAGAAGAAPTAANMPLGWSFAKAIIGNAGTIGGTTGAVGVLTIPVSGLIVTAGTGGAGLGAAASIGSAGGSITGAGLFPSVSGGSSTTSSTTPPGSGIAGVKPVDKATYFYGGTGGGATHGSATGAGLAQSSGGNGAPGCGGGGSGGARTGSTAGAAGLGGPAFCIITCW